MSHFLRAVFGLDKGELPGDSVPRFELTGLPHGAAALLWWLIVAGAVALIILLYRRERELKLRQRATLSLLRLGALLVVLWMLLDPRVLAEIQRKRDARTYLLLDVSQSMAEVDKPPGLGAPVEGGAPGVTRLAMAVNALSSSGVPVRLAQRNRLRIFSFDAKLHPVAHEAASDEPAPVQDDVPSGTKKAPRLEELGPFGQETRLGDVLLELAHGLGQEPVAGVVLISDGRRVGGVSLEVAGAELARRGVPVHAVGVGERADPTNISILEVAAPEVVEPGVPLQIQARVGARGLDEPVMLTLVRQPVKGGRPVQVEARKLEPGRVGHTTTLVFVDTLEAKGTYRYVLTAPELAREEDASDNRGEALVTAAEETCRVLLVAGGSSPEYKFLRNFLIRDPGLQVSCWLSSADPGYPQDGNVVLRDLPLSQEGLRPFDAVVLLDPDLDVIPGAFWDALRHFVVEEGGGLAYEAGEAFTDALFSSPGRSGLRALLPVERLAPDSGAAAIRIFDQPWRPILTSQGVDHPLCRLADDPDESERVWRELPPCLFHAAGAALRPAAVSLLERPGGGVILATQQAGAGYSVYLGTDDFYRWRSARRKGLHERFWGAVVRYLALGKKASGAGELSLYADRDRYEIEEEIVLEASLSDSSRKPITLDRVEVSIQPEAAATEEGSAPPSAEAGASLRLNLLPVADRPGWYAGRARLERPGRYTAALLTDRIPGATGDRSDSPASRKRFAVVALSTEASETAPDPEALEALAAATGGSFSSLASLGEVADRIPERSVTEIIGRSSVTVWDSTLSLILFCGLLILEWALRKLWRLN